MCIWVNYSGCPLPRSGSSHFNPAVFLACSFVSRSCLDLTEVLVTRLLE